MRMGFAALASMGALLAVAAVANAAPACDGVAQPIVLSVTQHMSLGTFARPDASAPDGTVTLAANGTRSLPPTLIIQSDTLNPARAPKEASAVATGGASCRFQITVDSTSSNLFNVTFQAASGYTFISSGTNVAVADIKASTSDFKFTIGVQALVSATPGTIVPGTITLRVTYVAS